MTVNWDNNELAGLFCGELPDPAKKNCIKELLTDPEGTQLLGLLSSPELRPENNQPAPFLTTASLLAGGCQGLLLALETSGIQYFGGTRSLASKLEKFLPKGAPELIAQRLNIEFHGPRDSAPLQLTLRSHSEEESFLIQASGKNGANRTLEFWENGTVVLRAPLNLLNDSGPFRLEPGKAVMIRELGASEGIRLLVVGTDLSPREWKAALLSSCLTGDFAGAFRILEQLTGVVEEGRAWIGKILDQIAAIATVTKCDQLLLHPAPTTRSAVPGRSDLLSAYRLVWNGIVHCWPEAVSLPNPWGAIGRSDTDDLGNTLGPETRALVHACLRSAKGESVEGNAIPSEVRDLRVRNGWAALLGWKAMLARDYQRARETFGSAIPLDEDPFVLEMTEVLAGRLESCETLGANAEGSSSDEVWRKVLSAFL